jgi:hypothetical protein
MRHYERSKRALYWTAVSLIVCEGLPLEQAARRMGVNDDELRDILHRRRTVRLDRFEVRGFNPIEIETRESGGSLH